MYMNGRREELILEPSGTDEHSIVGGQLLIERFTMIKANLCPGLNSTL